MTAKTKKKPAGAKRKAPVKAARKPAKASGTKRAPAKKPAAKKARRAKIIVEQIGNCTLYRGDCRQVLAEYVSEASVHAAVCDPPYGLSSEPNMVEVLQHWLAGDDFKGTSKGFMGKSWDSFVPGPATWREVERCLKPGGHLAAFAGSRTYDLMTMAIRLSGMHLRDQAMWLYGSGFPKSHDVSKGIDKLVGRLSERAVVPCNSGLQHGSGDTVGSYVGQYRSNKAASAQAEPWEGWGTALKPAHEPIAIARKPLSEGSVARNVLKHGTGGINIDACRIDADKPTGWGGDTSGGAARWREKVTGQVGSNSNNGAPTLSEGRWPANVMHDDSLEVADCFPASDRHAVRFFYSAKATREEREFGMAGCAAKGMPSLNGSFQERGCPPARNNHPTVKPIDLMRWLIRLVTPQGGLVLDPFMGSGSTGIAAVREGVQFIGCELGEDYFDIACRRIEAAVREAETQPDMVQAIERTPIKQLALI